MDPGWESRFRRRMRAFELGYTTGNDGTACLNQGSLTSGCFQREHSPEAYALIDKQLYSMPPDAAFAFEEHESGPEVLEVAGAGFRQTWTTAYRFVEIRSLLRRDMELARSHHWTMRRDLPSGTVTFLFTDVEGSTKLLHELGAERYAQALAEHRRVLRDAVTRHAGVEVDTQ